MKSTKSAWLAACALAGALSLQPVVRGAGSNDTPAPAANDAAAARRARVQEIAQELGLTDAQKEQLKPILQAEAAKVRALRDDQSLSRREKAQKLREIRDEVLPQVKAILTPEQFAKWEKLRQERRGEATGKGAAQP